MCGRFDGSTIFAFALAGLVVALGGPEQAGAQLLPQSPEFQINAYTVENQATPAIAADSQGAFVVVWEQHATAMPVEVYGRRFDSSGTGLGVDFHVNTYTEGAQRAPWVVRSAAGGFVVTWAGQFEDGEGYGVFGRRYDATGNPLAVEFQINTYTPGSQTFPKAAMRSGGDFVVVWQSTNNHDGNSIGVFGQRFDSAGNRVGAEFQVNSYITGDQQNPAVFLKPDASFIVTWNSNGQDGSGFGVFGRRFDSAGGAVGGEFQISTYTTNLQVNSTLAFNPSGGFVAVWNSQQDGSGSGIFGRQFDSVASAVGGEFPINTFTVDEQLGAEVTASQGGFVVVWMSDTQDGDNYGVFGRAFNAQAQPRGGETQINITTANIQRFPRMAATGQSLVVVWQSGGDQDGQFGGIFGRRYLLSLTLDVDGDGQFLPLTDALLILRYGFGFTGNTLIAGAVGANCTRCDAPSITAYLDQI